MNKLKLIFENFIAKFRKTVVVVNQDFTTLVGADAASNFKNEAANILKTDLGKITLGVVSALQAVSTEPGSVKKEEAVTQIVALTKAQGFNASQALINLFIELATAFLKNKI